MHPTGTVLRSRYKIIQPLGSGGFGKTYLAEDLDIPTNPKPKCVVKHLKPQNQDEALLKVAKSLFNREAEILYRLDKIHNQVPKLFAHFEENGEFYLVQEFIDGHDLSKEIIAGQPWDEAQVKKLLRDVLEILAVIHQQNIIHRDIKPQNIMRHQDGKIVLIDFGAVKEIKCLDTNTQSQVTSSILIGTNGYMPNEQANGKPKLCSDVYAVGMLGIQALTGMAPRDLPEDPVTGEIIWRDQANVSDRFAEVLATMVRSHFSQRYQTAAEALQALTQSPPPPPPSSPSPKPKLDRWRSLSNGKVMVTGGAVLLGSIVSLYVVSRYIIQSPTPPKPQAVTPKSLSTIKKFPQLPCDSEQQLASLPTATGEPTWETNIYRYYGQINPQTKEANGRGLMVFKQNNFQYYGDFKNNKRNGCGKLLYPVNSNINYYLGQFKNDELQGLGYLKWRNGNEYRGNFANNRCQGEGVYIFADKTERDGAWYEDKLEGSNLLCNKEPSTPSMPSISFLNPKSF
ncbi:protein kinase [Nostoc flagelliforme FACHB-838]|uniref:non-specific serine/threonine protein kinase n=1 Tax=Nostoc flagelliforme FACHB-838 TaxID=2692904 RepID=A0ABR8DN20_9NOSO|nr:protein kinase [Nostoc flagelliforme]MBD2530321.1 protein kinase [Nostoc flagelliforme FACHB-838]